MASSSVNSSFSHLSEVDQNEQLDEISEETLANEASKSNVENYSEMAARTVANIKRLQENVLSVNISSSLSSNNISTVSIGQASSSTPLQPPDDQQEQQQEAAGGNSLVVAKNSIPAASPIQVLAPDLTSSFNALVTLDPNWQSSRATLRERNRVMCNNALMADCYFNVNGKKFPAHKYILATGSTVFYAMFYGGYVETSSAESIDVPDVDPDAFLAMLKYLYCDEIDLNPDNVLATLYAAKKYLVPALANACVQFLEQSLTARNACLLLSQARLFSEPALIQRAWEVIDAQAELALSSEAFTEIDFDTLLSILSRESLNCKETVVFTAAVNWAKAECSRKRPDLDPEAVEDKRKVLGRAMNKIRFPAMSITDFADTVATSGILNLQETNDLFLHFTAKQKPSVEYDFKPRRGLDIQSCGRFRSSAYRSNQWRYRGRTDAIQFCVDKRVFIVGFGLYGSSNGSSDYTAKIELRAGHSAGGTASARLLASNTQQFFSDGSSNTFQVFFDQPVQVEPDCHYVASAVLDGAELSYFGQEGMSEVTVGNITFQFQCSSESTNGTGVQGGQIPELIFYGPTGSTSSTSTLKRSKSPENCQLNAKNA